LSPKDGQNTPLGTGYPQSARALVKRSPHETRYISQKGSEILIHSHSLYNYTY
jgi:hypothetical protein